jgi:hypothetical protein
MAPFSNASAGLLRVSLRGTFYQGTARDAGFPTGTSNYSLRGVVNGAYTEPIDRYAPVAYMDLAYPGGNASWAVSTETVSYSGSGVATYGIENLVMNLQLLKK